MILRVLKMVILPDGLADFLALYRESLSKFFWHSGTNLGIYLFEDVHNPWQFFVLTYWPDLESMECALRDETLLAIQARAQHVIIERDRSYHLAVSRTEPRPYLPVDAGTGAARLVLVVEPPQQIGIFTDLFDAHIDGPARNQAGCRSIQLFRQVDSLNRTWVLGIYRTLADLETWLRDPALHILRDHAQANVYERMEGWDMSLRIDDPRRPLSDAGAA